MNIKLISMLVITLFITSCNNGGVPGGGVNENVTLSNGQQNKLALSGDIKHRVTIGSAVNMNGDPVTIMAGWKSLTKGTSSGNGEIALIGGTSKSERTVNYNLDAYSKVTSMTASAGLNIMSRIGMNATSQYGTGNSSADFVYGMGALNYKTYSLPFNEDLNSQNNINRASTAFVLEANLPGLEKAIQALRETKGTPDFGGALKAFVDNYGFGYVSTIQLGSTYGFKGVFTSKETSQIFGVGGGVSMSPDIFGGVIGGSMSGGYNSEFNGTKWRASKEYWSYPANAGEKHMEEATKEFNELVEKTIVPLTSLKGKVSDAITTAKSLAPSVDEMKPNPQAVEEIKKNKTDALIKTADYYISSAAENIRKAISDKSKFKVIAYRKELLASYNYYKKTILLEPSIYDKFLEADKAANEYIQEPKKLFDKSTASSFSLYLTNNNKDSVNLIRMLTQMTDAEITAKHETYVRINQEYPDLLVGSPEHFSHTLDKVNALTDNRDDDDYLPVDFSYVSWDKLYPDIFFDEITDDYARIMKLKSLIAIKRYIAVYNYFLALRDIDNAANNTLPIDKEIMTAADNSRGVMQQLMGIYNELTTDIFDNRLTMGITGYKNYPIDKFNAAMMDLIHSSQLYKLNSAGKENGYIQAALRLYDTGLLSNSGVSISYKNNYHPEYFQDGVFNYTILDTQSKVCIPFSYTAKQSFNQANNSQRKNYIVASVLPILSKQTLHSMSINEDVKNINFVLVPNLGEVNLLETSKIFTVLGTTSKFPFTLRIPIGVENVNKAEILSSNGRNLGGYGPQYQAFPCDQDGGDQQCKEVGANYYANIIDFNLNYGKYQNDSALKNKKFNIYYTDPSLIPLIGITFGFTN